MKLPSDWLGEDAQMRMADEHLRTLAPVPLWGVMAALTGGQEPSHYLAECRVSQSSTEWRAIWLVGSLIAYGSISKSKEGWNTYSQDEDPHDMQPEAVDAWARSVREIVETRLKNVTVQHGWGRAASERDWIWSSASDLVFRDGKILSVPPFGEPESDGIEIKAQRFLGAIAQLLSAGE